MKVIGVIGSRRRNDFGSYKKVYRAFQKLIRKSVTTVVSGGCDACADQMAPLLAKKYGLRLVVHYPNFKRYGRYATFVRNTSVAIDADYLIAAPAVDRTGGTEDTIRKFLKRKPKKCLVLV